MPPHGRVEPAPAARAGAAGGADPDAVAGADADLLEQRQRRADDQRRVERALRGDRTAFEELFVAYRERVYGVVFGYVRDADDALDLTQDAFVKAFQKLASFKGESSFFTWITQIAIHLAIDHTRKKKRRRLVQLDDPERGESAPLAVEPAAVAKGLLAEELRGRYEEALEGLSDKHRTVFVLHTVKGMAYKEIASVLDISIGTVMSRLHYARKKIQALMGDYLEPG